MDVIVVGQGLVGSLVAHECMKRGLTVLVVDDDNEVGSTNVAAGIMNPLIGPRLTPLARTKEAYIRVTQYYHAIEQKLQVHFLNDHRLIRFLSSPLECQSYEQRVLDSPHLITPTKNWSTICTIGKHQFETTDVAQIDAPVFLNAFKHHFIQHDAYLNCRVDYKDVKFTTSELSWKGIDTQWMVFCEGASGKENPFFKDLQFKNAMGHVLKIHAKGIPKNTIFNHGRWLCPIANNANAFLYGATTFWDQTDANINDSLQAIQTSLEEFLKVLYRIESVIQGTRPCLIHKQPFFGWSKQHPKIGMINGLAGQGMFLAPEIIQLFCHQMLSVKR